jgi:hypothetical protein
MRDWSIRYISHYANSHPLSKQKKVFVVFYQQRRVISPGTGDWKGASLPRPSTSCATSAVSWRLMPPSSGKTTPHSRCSFWGGSSSVITPRHAVYGIRAVFPFLWNSDGGFSPNRLCKLTHMNSNDHWETRLKLAYNFFVLANTMDYAYLPKESNFLSTGFDSQLP